MISWWEEIISLNLKSFTFIQSKRIDDIFSNDPTLKGNNWSLKDDDDWWWRITVNKGSLNP